MYTGDGEWGSSGVKVEEGCSSEGCHLIASHITSMSDPPPNPPTRSLSGLGVYMGFRLIGITPGLHYTLDAAPNCV